MSRTQELQGLNLPVLPKDTMLVLQIMVSGWFSLSTEEAPAATAVLHVGLPMMAETAEVLPMTAGSQAQAVEPEMRSHMDCKIRESPTGLLSRLRKMRGIRGIGRLEASAQAPVQELDTLRAPMAEQLAKLPMAEQLGRLRMVEQLGRPLTVKLDRLPTVDQLDRPLMVEQLDKPHTGKLD